MKKLNDITTNTTSYGEVYHDDDQMIGKIIISDDKTFEGVIADSEKEYFVFGKIDDKTLSLYQELDDYNKLYKVEKQGRTYFGDCFIKTKYYKKSIGECKVRITNPDEYREVNEQGEIIALNNKIKKLKKNIQK